MDFSPSAPPPSYDEAVANNNKKTKNQQPQPSPQGQYNSVAINLPYQQQSPQIQQLPIQPNLVNPQYNQQTRTNIVVVQGGPLELGPFPTRLICPACHQSTLTRVEHISSCITHSMALFLCFTGLFIFSCLPYFFNSFKHTVHFCRKCGKYLGTHQFGR